MIGACRFVQAWRHRQASLAVPLQSSAVVLLWRQAWQAIVRTRAPRQRIRWSREVELVLVRSCEALSEPRCHTSLSGLPTHPIAVAARIGRRSLSLTGDFAETGRHLQCPERMGMTWHDTQVGTRPRLDIKPRELSTLNYRSGG